MNLQSTNNTTITADNEDSNWLSLSSRWFLFTLSKDTVLRIEGRMTASMQMDLKSAFECEDERRWWLEMLMWAFESAGAEGMPYLRSKKMIGNR